MTTTVLTTKGKIVIPSSIRKHLGLKNGMKFCVMEMGNRIVLQPLTREYFEATAGIIHTKGNLGEALIKERQSEKNREAQK